MDSFTDSVAENTTIEAAELVHITTLVGLSDLTGITIDDFLISGGEAA
jgi:hypothetical protein